MRKDTYSNNELKAIETFLKVCEKKVGEHDHPQDEYLRNITKIVFDFVWGMLAIEKERTEMSYNRWVKTR